MPIQGVPASELNFDIPNSLHLDRLANDLTRIIEGQTVVIPFFDFSQKPPIRYDGTAGHPKIIDHTINGMEVDVIILEGLFVLYDKNIRDKLNLKIFTLMDQDVCFARRLKRDVRERHKTFNETINQWLASVRPGYLEFVEPSKKYAQLIIPTETSYDSVRAAKMISGYISSITTPNGPNDKEIIQRQKMLDNERMHREDEELRRILSQAR